MPPRCLVPTHPCGGSPPRACSKYRPRQTDHRAARPEQATDQPTLTGVGRVPDDDGRLAQSVDELVEASLVSARDFGGIPSGARVVLTSGQQTGVPGATSLIMVREIPER